MSNDNKNNDARWLTPSEHLHSMPQPTAQEIADAVKAIGDLGMPAGKGSTPPAGKK